MEVRFLQRFPFWLQECGIVTSELCKHLGSWTQLLIISAFLPQTQVWDAVLGLQWEFEL